MKKSILIITTLLIAACGATKVLAPTQSDADRAATKYPGTTLADLNEGKSLFETKCTQCHGLKKPSSKTEAQWKQIVPDMAKRAHMKQIEIDEHAQAQILKYLVTYSKS